MRPSLARVNLHTTGLGERGSRVVFLHGLFGQGKNWTTIGKTLAEDHRVLLVDLPQHGRSPWSESWEYGDAVEQVAGLVDADDPATVVGHSLGGKVAMLVALLHPELVERLCVVDMSPVDYGETGRDLARYAGALASLDLSSVISRADAERQLLDDVQDPGVRAFLLQNLRREGSGDQSTWRWQANVAVLQRDLAEIAQWPVELLEDAAPYDKPVLWVAGERSAYITDEYAPAMQGWFPRVRKVTVKDAGHWVHSEQPAVFVEILRRFLAG